MNFLGERVRQSLMIPLTFKTCVFDRDREPYIGFKPRLSTLYMKTSSIGYLRKIINFYHIRKKVLHVFYCLSSGTQFLRNIILYMSI